MRLLPERSEHGWAPYLWLLYFGFFFIDPVVSHAGLKVWAATAFGSIAFFTLYFTFFWVADRGQRWIVAALVLLGLAFAPSNGGASTFFIFAGAFVPYAVQTERRAIALLLAVVRIAASRLEVAAPFQLVHVLRWRVDSRDRRQQHLFCTA